MNFIDEALKIANRSSIRTHKTGAVLVYRDEIISNGWSHVPEHSRFGFRSLHAEMHALARARHLDLKSLSNLRCYVAAVSGKSSNTCVGKPALIVQLHLDRSGFVLSIFLCLHQRLQSP